MTFESLPLRKPSSATCFGPSHAEAGGIGLLNVHHTVRGYEEAGISSIQIEDQDFQEVRPHPVQAVDPGRGHGRKGPSRSRCANGPGFPDHRPHRCPPVGAAQSSIARAKAYVAAGADIAFCEALTAEDEMPRACDEVPAPMMANMANGGLTPVLNGKLLEDIGYAFVISPSLTSLIAASAMETALRRLKDQGDGEPADMPMFDFKEFCGMIGFQEVWDFEKKWAR